MASLCRFQRKRNNTILTAPQNIANWSYMILQTPVTTGNSTALVAPFKHLKQLNLIRTLILCILWLTLIFTRNYIDNTFNYLIATLSVFSGINFLTAVRLKNSLTVTRGEFFIHLLIDVLCLEILFYFSGGANNPFISYLLVPICISAATLPWRFTWFLTALCLSSYTFLLFFYNRLPLFDMRHNHTSNLSWHILGMWFNFFISAILITYFVVKMAKTLREQDEALNSLREDELRNEQLMAVAMLAAGAAHEMNTPLSTMTVLLSELRAEFENEPLLISDLELLTNQVNFCANTLKQLVQHSSAATQGQFKQLALKSFCESIFDRWQLMRPSVEFNVTYAEDIVNKRVSVDPRIEQAIINLLNNAADASHKDVQINVRCDMNQLVWRIIDSGKGISDQLESKLGKVMLSTKEQGLGIGLLLAHATIKHYGGSLSQISNKPSGTITELRLPLAL
jgi:two-component system, sensor histidine kinase RegB